MKHQCQWFGFTKHLPVQDMIDISLPLYGNETRLKKSPFSFTCIFIYPWWDV